MAPMERRTFLRIAAFADPVRAADNLASNEVVRPTPTYGFVQDSISAFHELNGTRPFTHYEAGNLLRYDIVPEDPRFARIVQDSWRTFAVRNRAHGTIYIPTDQLKPLTIDDIAPINPDVPPEQKVIKIKLTRPQHLVAYEGDEPVYETDVSAGFRRGWTPTGEHSIYKKRWTRYMQGLDYDLPGVAFPMYFKGGVAIHGTFWHHDFGVPHSHGCVNVPNDSVQWLFRWTQPTMLDFNVEELKAENPGTRVMLSY